MTTMAMAMTMTMTMKKKFSPDQPASNVKYWVKSEAKQKERQVLMKTYII